jgi:hypothetical protein
VVTTPPPHPVAEVPANAPVAHSHSARRCAPARPGEDTTRRPLRQRARRPLRAPLLLQLQRHGLRVALRLHRRGGRLAVAHPHRGPRPLLPRPARRLALPLCPRHRGARGDPGRRRQLQVAAAPLGPGGGRDGEAPPARDLEAPVGAAALPLAWRRASTCSATSPIRWSFCSH